MKSLEVTVRANITVKSSIKNLVLRDASTVIPVMVYLDPVAVVAEGVPWWVILLAVLAGLLVLALLVLLMWKVRVWEAGLPGAGPPCRAGGLSCYGSLFHLLSHLFSPLALNTCMSQGLCQALNVSERSQIQVLSSGTW